jgi:RNA polymerase sigma-70 factor (ECF subfamily)
MARDPLARPEPLIKRVYAYVAYRIGAGPDADDVTAEAIARAVQYRDSFDPAKGEPVSWAIGIARRCVDDWLARPVEAPDPPDLPAPDDLEQEMVDRLTVRAAVLELGERDRELLALRYGADLSARQVAAELGLTTNAAEVALHRALARLREALAEQEVDPSPRA